jgi:D-alanyl-D-alanine dipeptidase
MAKDQRLDQAGACPRHPLATSRTGAWAGVRDNYPTEWWHWSSGDRYWALITKADNAIYGPA